MPAGAVILNLTSFDVFKKKKKVYKLVSVCVSDLKKEFYYSISIN